MREEHEQHPSPQSNGTIGGFFRLAGRCAVWCVASITVIGLVVRLTVRDGIGIWSPVFYATPLPLLVAGAAVCVFYGGIARKTRWLAVWSAILLLLLPAWWRHDVRLLQPPAHQVREDDLTLLFWNVARADDLTAAADYIRRVDADIVGLVEAVGNKDEMRAFWRQQLPDYHLSYLGGNLQILSRWSSEEAVAEHLHGGSISRFLRVHVRGTSYLCCLVDIDANLLRPRHPALQRLTELLQDYRDDHVVIMGDFNIPPDSIHLAGVREHYRLCFEAAGSGYAPTWPVPLPVLQLDQVWVNDRLQTVSCRHGFSTASDHRPVLVRLRRVASDSND